MRNSRKMYWCALTAVVMFASMFALGCEEQSTCYYQCEEGLSGTVEGLEDQDACNEAAEEECAEAGEGATARADFVSECEEEDEDEEGSCAPDWYEEPSATFLEIAPIN